MKKLFTIFAFTLIVGLSMISCTEEEIKPQGEPNLGGTKDVAKGF